MHGAGPAPFALLACLVRKTLAASSGGLMNFASVCWDCGADCVVWGEPRGHELYWLPDDFDCWGCGANLRA